MDEEMNTSLKRSQQAVIGKPPIRDDRAGLDEGSIASSREGFTPSSSPDEALTALSLTSESTMLL